MATVHIIGAGVSGLAAATKLAAAHVPVKLYESGTAAGGRARGGEMHLFTGAAKELQQFIRRVEAKNQFIRVKRPFALAPSLNAPLADHLQFAERMLLPDSRRVDQMAVDVSPLQNSFPALSRLALNNPAHIATAKQLQHLLRRQLRRGGWKFFAPKQSLQQNLIGPALATLEYLGGSIYFGQQLKNIELKDGAMSNLNFARKKLMLDPDDVVILATPAAATKSLLPGIETPPQQHGAILLHYAVDHTEPVGMRVLQDAPADLLRYTEGKISASIRIAAQVWHSDERALAVRVWKAIRALHPALPAALPDYTMWREKRAGHAPLAEPLPVPTLPERCLLAGDWLDATRAGTLEVATASGHRAAEQAMALIGKQPEPSQSDFYLN